MDLTNCEFCDLVQDPSSSWTSSELQAAGHTPTPQCPVLSLLQHSTQDPVSDSLFSFFLSPPVGLFWYELTYCCIRSLWHSKQNIENTPKNCRIKKLNELILPLTHFCSTNHWRVWWRKQLSYFYSLITWLPKNDRNLWRCFRLCIYIQKGWNEVENIIQYIDSACIYLLIIHYLQLLGDLLLPIPGGRS